MICLYLLFNSARDHLRLRPGRTEHGPLALDWRIPDDSLVPPLRVVLFPRTFLAPLDNGLDEGTN